MTPFRRRSVTRLGHGGVHQHTFNLARRKQRSDQGFSLIELLVVTVILSLIIGAISLSLVSVVNLKNSVADRLGASADAQIVAASFFGDVQSATQFTTMATPSGPAACGTSSELLGLTWSPSTTTNKIVSYAVTPNGSMSSSKPSTPEYNLMRYECTSVNGAAPIVTDTSVLSYNVPAGLVALPAGESCTTMTCSLVAPAPPSTVGKLGWASAIGLTNISVVVNEASTGATK